MCVCIYIYICTYIGILHTPLYVKYHRASIKFNPSLTRGSALASKVNVRIYSLKELPKSLQFYRFGKQRRFYLRGWPSYTISVPLLSTFFFKL